MKSTTIACAALFVMTAGGVALADDGDGDDTLVRARISGGPDAPAPGLGASISGGWGGAHAQAIGAMSAEGLIGGRLTIRAGVDYDAGRSRPSASASYVLTDASTHAVGVLIGVAYKPEGLTEPDGEMEATIAAAHMIGASRLSASVTYGQDADFKEHDGEVALADVTPIAKRIAVGGLTRYRNGLGSATDLGARWDGLAGGLARVQIDQYVLTFVGGSEVVGMPAGGTKLGVLGTVSLGAWF